MRDFSGITALKTLPFSWCVSCLFNVYLKLSLLTICKVRPLGEAQLMAVLCLTGIHGLGISAQTIKVNKGMGSFRR